VHLGEHLDRANLVAPMANAERLIPYLEQLLRCLFHIGRDLLLDFFFRGLLQLVDNFPDTLAARTSPRIGGECLGGFVARIARGDCSVCRRHTQREGLGKFLQRSSHSESICVRLRPIESLCLGNVTHELDFFPPCTLRALAANT
jgi:hypothetical protein